MDTGSQKWKNLAAIYVARSLELMHFQTDELKEQGVQLTQEREIVRLDQAKSVQKMYLRSKLKLMNISRNDNVHCRTKERSLIHS